MEQEHLKHKTIRAILWNFVDKFGQQIVYLILGIILGRILSPSDYGINGIIMIFITYSNILVDGGFGGALIRKKNPTQSEYSSVFMTNNAVALFLYGVVFLCAPLIASFFEEPSLTLLLRICLLSILFNAWGLIYYIRMSKEISFRSASLANLLALTIGGGIAVVCALNGAGVWALVIQNTLYALIRTILFSSISKWHPSLRYRHDDMRGIMDFGVMSIISQILNASFTQLFNLVSGKMFGKTAFGYYSQGAKWSDMVTNSISNTMQSALFPVFSEIQDQTTRLKNAYRKSMRFQAFVIIPLLICLAINARPLLIILVTDKWLPSVPYLQLMALGGIPFSFSFLNRNFIRITGDARLLVRLDIARILLLVPMVILTAPYGLLTMAVGMMVMQYVIFILQSWQIGRIVHYNIIEQLKDIGPYLLFGAISGALVYPICQKIESPILHLLTAGILYFVAYLSLAHLSGSHIFQEIRKQIAHYLKRN